MTSAVVNIKDKPTPYYDLYMGRENKWLGLEQSKWHNPFPMKAEWQRPGVLEQYLDYIINSPLMNELDELRGMTLACYCSPRKCHCHILVMLLEEKDIYFIRDWIKT